MTEINNLTTVPVNNDFLKSVAQMVLLGEGQEKMDLSVALIGRERMRRLNKKYRGINRSTDVLSFSYDHSGEIAICLGEVGENARRNRETFEKELARVLIHGILHLAGYDHERGEAEYKKMKEKEDYYLSRARVKFPSLSKQKF